MACSPVTVANCVLGLQAEQEGGSEVIDAVDTGGVVARGHQLRIRKMFLLQVSMDPEEKMPDTGE